MQKTNSFELCMPIDKNVYKKIQEKYKNKKFFLKKEIEEMSSLFEEEKKESDFEEILLSLNLFKEANFKIQFSTYESK